MQPYQSRAVDLSVHDGCRLWGSRVIVLPQGWKAIMKLVKESHLGVTRKKPLACGYVWWSGMDTELEDAVRRCVKCQENHKLLARAPMLPWEWPDNLGHVFTLITLPIHGKMVLVTVDTHSKWRKALTVRSATSHSTIERLRSAFAAQTTGSPSH